MVSHSELVITVLPRDENTAIKNYLEGNMTIPKLPPLNPAPSKTGTILDPFIFFYLRFVAQIIFISDLKPSVWDITLKLIPLSSYIT